MVGRAWYGMAPQGNGHLIPSPVRPERQPPTINLTISDHYLRTVDFTESRTLDQLSDVMTASELDPIVPVFQHGAFFADESNLYVIGGELTGQPYLTEQGEFLPTNWSSSSLTGNNVYEYDLAQGAWSQNSVNPSNADHGVDSGFCCGGYGYSSKNGTGYVYGGSSNELGSTQLNPIATVQNVTDEPPVGERSLMSYNTEANSWDNRSAPMQWTEGSQFVSLPGLETDTGGIFVALGGVLKPQNEARFPLIFIAVYASF
jgi:hypothetical protein